MAKTDLTLEKEFYRTILHDCNVIFDVGCRDDNVFYEINPKAQIHLFDPNEVNIMEEVEGLKNVHFNNYALGAHSGIVSFHHRYGSIIMRTEEPKFEGMHQSIPVDQDTIKNYCKNRRIDKIDFLKIDTEGYDFEVIKGLGDIPFRYCQFEAWDDGRFGGETDEDIFDFFAGWNIYKLNTRPVNYVITKETLDFKIDDIIQLK
jgi:FkbM family methyltransferase